MPTTPLPVAYLRLGTDPPTTLPIPRGRRPVSTPQRQPAIPKAPADRPVQTMSAKAAAAGTAPVGMRPLSTRIPEYLDELLRVATFERRESKQSLITAALKAYLEALPEGK